MVFETASRAQRTRRSVLVGGVAAISGALLAACAGPQASQQQAAPANKEPVKLSFLSWRPPAMTQFKPFWDEYQKKHNVILEVDDSGDYAQKKITTMFVADSGPDLFDTQTGSLPKMYDNGFILEISKYLSRDKINLDKDWGVLGIERWRQKTYSVPYWVEPFGIYYNKSLFKEKGVEDPWERSKNQGEWTMDEMVQAAQKINDPTNDIWGLDWGPNSAYNMGPLIWTLGKSHLQYDPKIEWQLTMPEVTQAFGQATNWLFKQKIDVTSPIPEAKDSRDRIQGGRKGISAGGVNRFSQGNIGIHYRSVNDWRRMWPVIGTSFEWDMLPVPSISGKPGAAWSAGHPVAAYAKTKHPDAAWAFMSYLMNDEFQGVLAENQFLVPAKKKFQQRFYRPPEQYKYQHPQVFADVYKKPYGIIFAHFNANDNISHFNTEAMKMIQGDVPLQGGLADLERVLNTEIDFGGGENPFKGIHWPIQPH